MPPALLLPPSRLLPPLLLLLLLLLALQLLLATTGCFGLVASDLGTQASDKNVTVVNGTIGEEVVLPCELPLSVTKDKSFNVIWLAGKVTLTLKARHLVSTRISMQSKGLYSTNRFNLVIKDLVQADSKIYRCVARRDNHPFVTRYIKLMVNVPPIIDESHSSPTYKTLDENSSYNLSCVAEGEPAPTIRWYKLSDDSNDGDRMYLGEGTSYEINNVTRGCEGSFVCVAHNGIQPDAVKKFHLTVKFKPQVILQNKEISQSRGQSSMVMCIVRGHPSPEFYWERNGIQHKVSHRRSCEPPGPVHKYCLYIQQRNSIKNEVRLDLMVNNLTAEDFGEYYCVAKSPLGEARAAAHIVEKLQPPAFDPNLAPPRLFEFSEVQEKVPFRPDTETRAPPNLVPEPGKSAGADEAITGHSRSLTSKSNELNSGTKAAAWQMSAVLAAAAAAATMQNLV